jgi:DNA-binding NtrC family response regulator
MKPLHILIIDDEEHICSVLARFLSKEGYTVSTADNGRRGLQMFHNHRPDIILSDISMPQMDGMEFLQAIRAVDTTIPVVLLTGTGTVKKAIQAMQLGATDYITKPFSMQVVVRLVSNIAQALRAASEEQVHESLAGTRHELLGSSVAMQSVGKLIGAVSVTPNHTSVLILGESGTGKELVARVIHDGGMNADKPFVALNCAALPENLLESELFGHERGAFTGATQARIGKFEAAGEGTIFLDEIGELSLHLQQKLLRALQEREYERIGGNTPAPIKARFIAATNRHLPSEIKAGRFREDLYYRLNVFPIHLPPLRERMDDVLPLAEHFLALYSNRMNKHIRNFSPEARQLLLRYHYPGNVRELENMIERAVALTRGQIVTADAFVELYTALAPLPPTTDTSSEHETEVLAISNANNPTTHFDPRFDPHFESLHFEQVQPVPLSEVQGSLERQFLINQLKKYAGNVSETALASGMTRQNLYYLLKKHGLRAEDYRSIS